MLSTAKWIDLTTIEYRWTIKNYSQIVADRKNDEIVSGLFDIPGSDDEEAKFYWKLFPHMEKLVTYEMEGNRYWDYEGYEQIAFCAANDKGDTISLSSGKYIFMCVDVIDACLARQSDQFKTLAKKGALHIFVRFDTRNLKRIRSADGELSLPLKLSLLTAFQPKQIKSASVKYAFQRQKVLNFVHLVETSAHHYWHLSSIAYDDNETEFGLLVDFRVLDLFHKVVALQLDLDRNLEYAKIIKFSFWMETGNHHHLFSHVMYRSFANCTSMRLGQQKTVIPNFCPHLLLCVKVEEVNGGIRVHMDDEHIAAAHPVKKELVTVLEPSADDNSSQPLAEALAAITIKEEQRASEPTAAGDSIDAGVDGSQTKVDTSGEPNIGDVLIINDTHRVSLAKWTSVSSYVSKNCKRSGQDVRVTIPHIDATTIEQINALIVTGKFDKTSAEALHTAATALGIV